MNRQACPHCGKLYERVEWHTRYCLLAPAVRDLVLQAMTDPDKPGCAVSRDAYDLRAREIGAATARALIDQLGKWATVCAVFGLKPPPAPNRTDQEAAAIADTAAMLKRDEEVRAWAADPGMEVCRVRRLPDGRLAMELR